MQKITFSFKPRSEARADGSSLVYLIIRIDSKRKDISTNQYVPLKNWDHKKQCLKSDRRLSAVEALEKMRVIESLRQKLKNLIDDAAISGTPLTHRAIELALSRETNVFELTSFMEDYIARNPDNWKETTSHSYRGALAFLKEEFGKLYLEDITDLQRVAEKALAKRGSNVNTRKKRHRQIKTMLKHARDQGYAIPVVYKSSIGVIKGNRNFLTVSELERAIRFYQDGILKKGEQNSLRLFLFCCFTGCRFGDLEHLTHKNINNNTLIYVAEKTERFNKRIQTPLPVVAIELISSRIGKLFKVPSNQVINRHLNGIFKSMGINKHISFHCSRHTFGTLFIYLGGDVTNLQLVMGHSDIQTTMNYVQLAKKIDSKDHLLFDETFAKSMKVITKIDSEWMYS